jgi:putative ABC transport system permease protein
MTDLLAWVLAQLRRSPGRSLLAMLGVALGAALLVSLLSVIQGIRNEAEASAVWLATPGRLVVVGNRLQDPDVARLANLGSVRDALPVLVTPLELEHAGHHLPRGTAGLGFSAHAAVPYRLVAGSPLDPVRSEGVVLSRSAAEALGFVEPDTAIGQPIQARAATNSAPPASQDLNLVVVGVADELGDQNAIVGLPLAEDVLAQTAAGPAGVAAALGNRLAASVLVGGRAAGLDPLTYTAVLVVPQDVSDVPLLSERLRSAGYNLAGAGRVPAALERTFRLLGAGLGTLGLLASLGAALGVAQVLASRTAERTAEIGLLKALGASDGQVALLVGAEALVLGAVGGLVGVLAGWAGALGLCTLAQLVFGPLPVPRATPGLLLATPLLTTLLALLAAAVPARRAWRLLPAHALRHS